MDGMLLDNLHISLCRELDEISRRGIQTHEDLDMAKDILESIKNIYKIKKYKGVDGGNYGNEMQNMQFQNSYGGNSMMDNSMRNGPMMNNSYGYNSYYNPEYNQRNMGYRDRGYSGASKEDMVHDLKSMLDETKAADVKQAISNCISLMEK